MTRPLFPELASLADALAEPGMLLAVVAELVPRSGLTSGEKRLLQGVKPCRNQALVRAVREAVSAGLDPLGDAWCEASSAVQRRGQGQTFTPANVVDAMVGWAQAQEGAAVRRIVDPGAGTGRYTLAALRRFPEAGAIAVELDPRVALLLRANLAAADLAHRAQVLVEDFRRAGIPPVEGATLWIGNPPYVRHHDIGAEWKAWYSESLRQVAHEGSQLAGLHLHFFLRTLQLAAPGDIGCYLTAAEWLDVNYGSALRGMLTNGLGGQGVFVVDPSVALFGDAMVSAAITCFAPGRARASIRFAQVRVAHELLDQTAGSAVPPPAAAQEPKWSFLLRGGRPALPAGHVELGEVFRISRGHVTGANRVWLSAGDTPWLPEDLLVPAITDSREITGATAGEIRDGGALRRLVCLPAELDALDAETRRAVQRFLAWARRQGAHEAYVARQRKPWWHLPCKAAPPLVMTYMGRRPPAFAINGAGAQIINIAHGLYPRAPLSAAQEQGIKDWLNANVSREQGRVYAGGLTKFEPSEAMRIGIPRELVS
jgi:adenine-specific DNA-methyltransferase